MLQVSALRLSCVPGDLKGLRGLRKLKGTQVASVA